MSRAIISFIECGTHYKMDIIANYFIADIIIIAVYNCYWIRDYFKHVNLVIIGELSNNRAMVPVNISVT